MARHDSTGSSSWESAFEESHEDWLLGETMVCLGPQDLQVQLQSAEDSSWTPQDMHNMLVGSGIAPGDIMLSQHLRIDPSSCFDPQEIAGISSDGPLGSTTLQWPGLETWPSHTAQIPVASVVGSLPLTTESPSYYQGCNSSSSSSMLCGTLSTGGTDLDNRQRWQSERPKSLQKTRGKKHTVTTQKDIEARYRTKLKDKITHLQQVVPTIRARIQQSEELNDGELVDQDLHGLEPARNLKKGTIMTKTIEYIEKLEDDNQDLTKKLRQLEGRCSQISRQLATLGAVTDANDIEDKSSS